MANIDVMYSSKTDQWATPDDFFKELDQEFHFNLDPCADEQNHKCEKYFTKEDNGLSGSPIPFDGSYIQGCWNVGEKA